MAFGSPDQATVDWATHGTGMRTAETIDTRQSKRNMVSQSMGAGTYLDPSRAYNPAADPRGWAVSPTGMGRARAPKLLRGRLSMWEREVMDVPGSNGRKSRSVNFLYNPNTVTHSYEFDASAIGPMSRQGEDVKTPVLMSGQSVAWKLYFNRQYDVNDNRGDPDKRAGVLADVQALERVMGVFKEGVGVAAQICIVVFGSTQDALPFGYYGYISSVQVNYLMFTHRMIPTVCEVDIQMAIRMVPEGTPSTASGEATQSRATSMGLTQENFAQGTSGPENARLFVQELSGLNLAQ